MTNEKKTANAGKQKQPPILFNKTQEIIARVNQVLGGTLVTYFNNPRGSVCHDDVLALFELLEKIGHQKTIYLFIKSSGGNGQASLRLVNLLRQYCDEIVAVVPLECASAATMIALGANEIHMGPMAYLTPVDTSLTHALSPIDRDNDRVSVSLDELTRVVRLWQAQKSDSTENPYQQLFQHVHPLVIGAVDRAESLSIMLCKELLAYHIKDEGAADRIAGALNAKYPSHGYPILFEEARRIGLKVSHLAPEINSLLLELNELYSEMGQRATTDFDDTHAHSNEILNIWESAGVLVHYQQDKDWFYRTEERRWISLNDNSSWRRMVKVGSRVEKSILHIA
jgi:hypothetical protein